MLATHNNLLPLWATLTLIVICLGFSALFSGLNLGLMSLDRTELKIISNTGTDKERKYSRAIMPVRDHGNYLLCSILLGNVAVNSTFTILLDGLTSGLFAVILSTLAIVLLGEITPQAICSRHGLMIGAKTIMITKAVMALTAPMAYPVSKLLDYFLGEEIGSVYNRERLKELVKCGKPVIAEFRQMSTRAEAQPKVTTDVNDLDKDEVNIISGALELRKKTVSDVMTKLEDAFMLPITSILDFETMSEIIKSGYSRIPVYEGSRVNVVTVLFIKDLAFVDPDDNTPLKTLCQYYQNPCNFVFEDVTLDVMFKQFKEGHKGHMAFVHRINNEGEGDPFYETIGLVTLEDVIEEMIQAEIVDETDVFMDNRTKRRRNRPQNKLQDFAAFAEKHENQRIHISPQLTLATFQFLSTSVDAFRPDTVSETVLRRLLKQDVIQHIKVKNKSKRDACTYVFQQGKPVDYFVLVLEGRVEVTVGRENLVFEAGPFTYFGVQALTQNIGVAESPTPSAMGSLQNINMDSMLRHTFVPDYSVRAITELYYLTVKRSLYLAAKRATLMEKGALSKGATNEQFDTEVDKSNTAKNTIELMQIPKSKYVSLDNVNEEANQYNRSNQHLNKPECWSNITNQSLANTSTKAECWRTLTKSVADFLDNTHDDVTSSSNDLANNLDANNCAECLKNNFWIKPVTGDNSKDYELYYKAITCIFQLLQSVDEDISISGEHKTPSRQVSPNPMPVSASPLTRSSFARASPDKNGDKPDEQEKLLK
ncbi:Metal transporter CNNM2 [Papilio machaon]|uniref:Metal transporter CNNM2 n=1 Tax=Papilio machaon TaxID=76193 RepID=A0A0N1IFF6_PAPMA|nr:Metal transporter CNNM2 [Papilio machaon]